MIGLGRESRLGLDRGGPRPKASRSSPPTPPLKPQALWTWSTGAAPGPELAVGADLWPFPLLPFSWSQKVRVASQALQEGSWELQVLPRRQGSTPEG